MLCQLVCTDRRYAAMNCFNIRELQGILKRKFFTDIINTHDHKLLNIQVDQKTGLVVTSAEDGTVKVWNPKTTKLNKVLELAKGDLQIAIRFLFQDEIDERMAKPNLGPTPEVFISISNNFFSSKFWKP